MILRRMSTSPARLLLAGLLLTACGDSAASGSLLPSAADSSVAESGSATPSGSVQPTAPGELAVGGWAKVVVSGLNLRQSPGTDAESLGHLVVGSSGLIVGGPVQANGYTWYEVAAAGLPYETGCEAPDDPTLLTCPGWFGWIAAADQTGNPWLEPVAQACPSVPTSAAELVAIQPGVRVYCFGGQALVIDAYLWAEPRELDCLESKQNLPYHVIPEWLDVCRQTLLSDRTEGGVALLVAIDPALGTCYRDTDLSGSFPVNCPLNPYLGQWIQLEGHYGDSAAAACVGVEAELALDQARIVYNCRQVFVVTAVGPGSAP